MPYRKELMGSKIISAARAAFAAVCIFGTSAAVSAAEQTPEAIVKIASEKLLIEVRERNLEFRADPEKFYGFVDKVIVPHFDWPYITRLILARNWGSATEDQRARFASAFQTMLIRTYADALLEYHDAADVQWLPTQAGTTDKDLVVRSQLNRADGRPPIPIGFAMLKRDEAWKVYDITIESSSVINSFRGQYNAEIRANGLQGLIERLESVKPKTAAEVVKTS